MYFRFGSAGSILSSRYPAYPRITARVVDLVGDAGREDAEGRHLLLLREGRLHLLVALDDADHPVECRGELPELVLRVDVHPLLEPAALHPSDHRDHALDRVGENAGGEQDEARGPDEEQGGQGGHAPEDPALDQIGLGVELVLVEPTRRSVPRQEVLVAHDLHPGLRAADVLPG
jgi:hypothetical protein